jgi:hypothetical protein
MPSILGQDDGSGFGVKGTSNSGPSASGVLGKNEGNGNGVSGTSKAGNGVLGVVDNEKTSGVLGRNDSAGSGISGLSQGGNGVFGQSGDEKGVSTGVFGLNTGSGTGVVGFSPRGQAGVLGHSDAGKGVFGNTTDNTESGVYGMNSTEGKGAGVTGFCSRGDGVAGISKSGHGVFGQTTEENSVAVVGENLAPADQFVAGVAGLCNTGWGVVGLNQAEGTGVFGLSQGAGDNGAGVVGQCVEGDGVRGSCNNDGFSGVVGRNRGAGHGVKGVGSNGTGVGGYSGSDLSFLSGFSPQSGVIGASSHGDGVFGISLKKNGFGVSAWGGPDTAAIMAIGGVASFGSTSVPAGNFLGTVGVIGKLNVLGDLFVTTNKHFMIDHPLAPADKYLLHASVESSELKNIYDGTVVLDAKGEAVVELPGWFAALNKDFRYQLTAIGAPSPNLHVAEEMRDNRFKIAGGRPEMKVSWQVTGIRHDLVAQAHPLQVEKEKPDTERGYYLHPELYNQPEEKGISWAQNPDLMRQMYEQQHRLSVMLAQQREQSDELP